MYRPIGFTLVELMVSVAILSILLVVAVPSYQSFVVTNRIATQTNSFISALTLARSEAVKRGSRVTMCKSANQSACATADAWSQGWLIFADDDNDGNVDTGEQVLQTHSALPAGLTLAGDSMTANYVSYVATGATRKNDPDGGGLQNGTLTMCHAQSGKARSLTVNQAGRLTLNSEVSCS